MIAMPAARVTEVGAEFAGGAFAAVFKTLMMRPQRFCFIAGRTARVSFTASLTTS